MKSKRNTLKIDLPVNPVPCSRPRVRRDGRVYYGKTYNAFRKEAEKYLQGCDISPLTGPLSLVCFCQVRMPMTTKLDFPRGDIDNYLKSILDALNGIAFEDDAQIKQIEYMNVTFAENEDEVGYFVELKQL